MKTEKSLLEKGKLLEEFGKQYFITVSEAFRIGRVKWEIVPIGKGGKNSIGFHLPNDKMRLLCEEIKAGIFEKKILADAASQYPSAYKYVTGADGSLRLNIGGGKMGCRVQLQDATTKRNYTIAVSIDSFKTMAFYYDIASGQLPVVGNSYYGELVKAFNDGISGRSKYHSEPEDVGDVSNAACEEEEQTQTELSLIEQPAPDDGKFLVVVSGKPKENDNFVIFPGTIGNEKINLLFDKKKVGEIGWYPKFLKKVEGGEKVGLRISGEKKGGYVLFKG